MRGSRLPLLTFVVATVTAIALLAAATSVDVAQLDPLPARASKDAVRRFYDAVNVALATGEAAALDAVVAADFVEHESVPGLPPDRVGLKQYLATVRTTFPAMRLSAEGLTAEGDLVMARVTAQGTMHGAFLSIPLTTHVPPWGRVERFRVADGMIIERWADADGLSLLQPLQQARMEMPGQQVVSVERVSHELGGSRLWWDRFGRYVIAVESGRLTVRVAATSPIPALLTGMAGDETARPPEPIVPGTELTLLPGQLLIVPPGAICTTGNDDMTRDVILVVAITTPQATGPAVTVSPTWPPAVATQVLAGDLLTAVPNGLATVAIGRATLAPGGELPRHQAAGPELVAVEAGSLALAITGEPAWIHHGADGHGSAARAATLTAGDGALVPAGAAASFRNSGDTPVVLLVATISPAGT